MKIYIFLLLFLINGEINSDSFVKSKKPKRSALMQDIAEVNGTILKLSTQDARFNAQLQEIMIDQTTDLAEPADGSFFAQATIEQLQKKHEQAMQIKDNYECIIAQKKKMLSKIQ